jgi:hypothetical protein
MKKLILALFLTLVPTSLLAITGTTCPGDGCLTYAVSGRGSAGVQITGTWSGTITFQGSVDNSTFASLACVSIADTSSALVTTTTSNGTFKCVIAGLSSVRIVFTSYSSGTANVFVGTAQAALTNGGGGGGGGSGTVTSVATTSPITGGTISTTGTIACATCGVTSSGLNQFASTTSSQLAGVISDETGSGALAFATSPTIVTPTIASFTNATHNHQNNAGGGTLAEAALALTDVTTNNSSTSNHGFLKKLDNTATHFMDGTGNWSTPTPTLPIFLTFTDPTLQSFSWVNQGTATLNDANAISSMTSPQIMSGDSLHLRCKTAPSTPYTITVSLMWLIMDSQAYGKLFVAWRDSGGGGIVIAGLQDNGSPGTPITMEVTKFTNATSFSADYKSSTGFTLGSNLWMQISDNGTNRITRFSVDGSLFYDYHSVGRTDFITPNQVCWGTAPASMGGSLPLIGSIISWKES